MPNEEQYTREQLMEHGDATDRREDGSAGCGCIEKVRKKLEEYHKSEISLELKQTINTETLELGEALPPLYYSHRDGKKWKKSYVHFAFCPFCGKRSR